LSDQNVSFITFLSKEPVMFLFTTSGTYFLRIYGLLTTYVKTTA